MKASGSMYAVVHYVAANGPCTQRSIQDALDIPQSTVSRVLSSAAGIVKNTSVIPTVYSFDPAATLPTMSTNTPNDTGVIRPDGRILIGASLFTPVPDTLAELSTQQLRERIVKFANIIVSQANMEWSKKTWEQAQGYFDELAITISCRIEKGDFDGN